MQSVKKSVSKRSWKRIVKFLLLGLTAFFIVFILTVWIVFEKKNQWLLKELQGSINESRSGQLKIQSMELSLLRSFPGVTVVFNNLNFYERHDSLRAVNEKPIVHAEKLFVALDLIDLMYDELNVSEISLSDAELNIIEYRQGVLNLTLALAPPVKEKPKVVVNKETPIKPSTRPPAKKSAKPKPKTSSTQPKEKVKIDLEAISFSEVTLTWRSFKNRKPSIILVEELEVDLSKSENNVDVEFNTSCTVQALNINRVTLPTGNLTIDLELQFDRQTQLLTIPPSEITYNELSATLEGTYTTKNQFLDLEVDASANDLELLSMFIKPEVLKRNPDLLKQADVYAKGKIAGELLAPRIDLSFGLRDLDLNLPRNLGTFKNVGFDGSFTSGASSDYSQAGLEIKNLRGELPGGFLKGGFSLKNFTEPYLQYTLDAKLTLDGYDEIFNLTSLKQLTGSVSLHADFDGPLKYFKQHTMDSSRSSSIELNDLSFVLAQTNQKVSGLSGKIENKNNLATIQHLTFTYGKNDLLIDGAVENLMHFMLMRDTTLTAYGKVQSRQLYTKDFIFDTLSSAYVNDRISDLAFDFRSAITVNDTSGVPDISFVVKDLSATLDKLPDLKLVDARGKFSQVDSVFKLDLQEFHATLPQGKVDIAGDLLIPQERLWKFNARVNLNKLPWIYVKELAAEIRTDQEPNAKNLPVKKMDLITGELDLSAAVITYPFDFNKLDVRNSKITIHTANSKTLSVNKLDIALESLHFQHPDNSGSLTGIKHTTGTMSLKQLKLPGLNTLDFNLDVTGKNDSLDISFSSATQVAKSEKGKLFIDLSKKERSYQLQYTVTGASLDYFVEKFYKKNFMKGEIDYTLDLHATGSAWADLKKNMAGAISITGDSLHLDGVDIDKLLRRFERSQNFNLTDIGAVLIAGPVGLAVTKGSDFVSLATINLNPNHHSFIKELHTTWKLEDQQLITEDVAFATLQNRVAFNGSIDFARDSIPGLTIAVVDKNGCALMDQRLYGKTNALKTGKLNIAKTLFGSVINFVNVIVGKDCEPVYTGSVKPPL